MDKRVITVILFALTIAASASYLVYAMLVRHMTQGTQVAGARAIVAAHDLPLGSVIRESDIRVAEMATPVLGSLASKEEIIGRGVTSNIFQGEPILDARLSAKGAGGGLAGLIQPGMRAAAVRVNEVVGVSGFVRPGMHVDVITSGAPPDSMQRNIGTVSRIVLQNIEVLSAGQDLDRDAEGKPVPVQVVNVLVTPEQAETLSLASEAKVQLILRNPLDKSITRTPGTNTAAMFNGGEVRPAPATPVFRTARPMPKPVIAPATPLPAPQPVTVEVVNGNKRETVTLGYTNPALSRGIAQ